MAKWKQDRDRSPCPTPFIHPFKIFLRRPSGPRLSIPLSNRLFPPALRHVTRPPAAITAGGAASGYSTIIGGRPTARAGLCPAAGQRHSLRGDVEADISVLPQHVQHRAHGCCRLSISLRRGGAAPRQRGRCFALPQRSGWVMAGAGPALPPARAVRGRAGTGREGASRTVCQPRSPMLLPGLRSRLWALCGGRQSASGRWTRSGWCLVMAVC